MSDVTCSTADCDRPVRVRKRQLCAHHYGIHYRAGTLPGEPVKPKPRGVQTAPDGAVHVLSDVNEATKTALCSTCGPTGIKVRKGRTPVCRAIRRQESQKYAEPRRKGPRQKHWSPEDRLKYAQQVLPKKERERLMVEAAGACQICGTTERLVVDHCHTTGRIRGVLCHWCNVGISWMRDSPERMLTAASYLRQ